ncbi:unnamed protein product [Musa acuminata subsp. burmannicoides]
MGSSPHALLLPYPAQGHVIPLMALAHCLVDHGFKVTFVNTEFNYARLVAALADMDQAASGRIELATVPDGLDLEDSDARSDIGKLTAGILKAMPPCLEELISRRGVSGDQITCVIADQGMAWTLEVAKKMGVRAAAFWPASAAVLATMLSIPELIARGVIDANGLPMAEGLFELGPGVLPMNTAYLGWNHLGDRTTRSMLFNYIFNNARATAAADFLLCNSFQELEAPVFAFAPSIIPIGPVRAAHRPGKLVGHLWQEDTACTAWLDGQPPGSVVYVAFGSFTILDRRQFHELALGLELSGRPFLWVVRPDLTDDMADAYPPGFIDRVACKGKMVRWAPQDQVLARPAIGCFISHCGWNSTMEAISNGVPLLCWPYFGDQFVNQTYVCDDWKTGLKMVADESGIITKEEISCKLHELLGDVEVKNRAMALKEAAHRSATDGGSSYQNLTRFVAAMKE